MSESLDDIGLAYGTDKASDGHDYLKIYEKQIQENFAEGDHGTGSLLELGWWDGASMKMWSEWLPEWTIAGFDIEAKEPISDVIFTQGDQSNATDVHSAAIRSGPFDVIVDDASHISPLTIASFRLLWPHLNPGGLYFVEDLQVSYHRDWIGNPDPRKPGIGGPTSMQFLKGLTDSIHHGHATVRQEPSPQYIGIDHMAFWPGLCMIRKADA